MTTISVFSTASAAMPVGFHGESQGVRIELLAQPFGSGAPGCPPVQQCTK